MDKVMDTNAMDPMPGPGSSLSHPSHYANKGIEPREYIRANDLDFNEGNVVKYITRHNQKDGMKDIVKVITYAIFILEDNYGFTKQEVDYVLADIMANTKHRL